ncbi:MAG: rod shape-determining protein MreC [Clostridia bacterium]|nr:rod shape-determining protein MreC [Clostridia bacterium]
MRQFFSSVKFKIILSVFAALLLGIFIAAVSDSGTSPLSTALETVMQPLTVVSRIVQNKLDGFRADFRSAGYYREEVLSLEDEVASLKEQQVDYEKIRNKLSSYESFLEVKSENPDYAFVPARIILRDASDVFRCFTVNKGLSDGVQVNDPVIYGKNLVGVVKEVNEKSALVHTLFTPGVSVSVYEIRTREDCYTEAETGLSLTGMIRLAGLSRTTTVSPGGVVCTSGIGGIYPRDLIVGTVTDVAENETDASAYGLITPDVDPMQITDVFIITDFDGKAG